MPSTSFLLAYGPILWPLILVVATVTGASLVGGIGAARVLWRVRRARASLGARVDAPAPKLVGQTITLSGTLSARGALCARYDDGEEAAAAVATRYDEGAGVSRRAGRSSDPSPRRDGRPGRPGDRTQSVFPEVCARAATLVLDTASGPVFLEGPVRVVVGSREVTRGTWVTQVKRAVLDRVGATDLAVEWELQHAAGPVWFRSLATGDRVLVSGMLARHDASDEGLHGYREAAARWCLVPPPGAASVSGRMASSETACVRAAFEGLPGRPAARWRVVAGGVAAAALCLGALDVAGSLAMSRAHEREASAWQSIDGAPDFGEQEAALAAATPFAWDEAMAHLRRLQSAIDRPVLPEAQERKSPDRPPRPPSWEDELERCLDASDYECANQAAEKGDLTNRQRAQLSVVAGDFDTAADVTSWRRPAKWHSTAPCMEDALLVHGGAKKAASALERLRIASREPTYDGAVCRLLLADVAGGRERDAALAERETPLAHDDRTGPMVRRRIRSLLELEAGRSPSEPPEPMIFPDATGLFDRPETSLEYRLFGVHVARALAGAPGPIAPSRWLATELCNAAFVLSALGDHLHAQSALVKARELAHLLDATELAALDVALQLRSGSLVGAQRAALPLPPEHPVAKIVVLVEDAGQVRLPDDPRWARLANKLVDARGDATSIRDELLDWHASFDGQGLFLAAPWVKRGREVLLHWARHGNPQHARVRGKSVEPAPTPLGRLMVLEERRSVAATLGDEALAEELADKLARGRERVLRRDIAVLLSLL